MSYMSFTFNDKNVIKSWKDTTSNKMYVVYIYKLQYVFLYGFTGCHFILNIIHCVSMGTLAFLKLSQIASGTLHSFHSSLI